MLTTRYSLDIPNFILDKIRTLSLKRKISKSDKRFQKDIIIELIENGLVVTDDTPTLTPSHEETPQPKEVNNTLPIFP